MFNMKRTLGTTEEIMDIIEKRMINLDKTLGCVGMTLNVGEDSKGRGVYRIERDNESDVTKIMEIITSTANGTLVETIMFDATVPITGAPSFDMQVLSNTITVLEYIADGIVKMFMVVAEKAVKDDDIVRRMLAVNEDIANTILEAASATDSMRKERGKKGVEMILSMASHSVN